jgi:tetratricopeptide (TPR) repeat protein
MSKTPLPPPPQTGWRPITLSERQEERLLSQRHAADHSDVFAADSDPAIRRLGRLALRRGTDVADYFALGDLCATKSIHKRQVQVAYVEKTLLAYNNAERLAGQFAVDSAIKQAQTAVAEYITWLLEAYHMAPEASNAAAVLWAVVHLPKADYPPGLQEKIADVLANLSQFFSLEQTVRMPNAEVPKADQQTIETPSRDRPSLGKPIAIVRAIPVSDTATPAPMAAPEPDATQDEIPIPKKVKSGMPASAAIKLSAPSASIEQPQKGEFQRGERFGEVRYPERYEVRRVLRGGMGVVYLCYDHVDQVAVAIKSYQGRLLGDSKAQQRFINEAKAWIDLEKHPNIVRAHRVDSFGSSGEAKRPHLVLEYVAGAEDLSSELDSWIKKRRLSLATALLFAAQVSEGMRYAAEKITGLVHRDLKPGNILVSYDQVAKVTDFGLVRADTLPKVAEGVGQMSGDSQLTGEGMVMGTVAYMSPEQCMGKPLDARSDIYAFGAIVYQMLAFRPLFDVRGNTAWIEAHIRQMPKLPSEIAARLPSDLVAFLYACLAKSPEDRPTDWLSVRDQMAAFYKKLTDEVLTFDMAATHMARAELMDKAYSLTEIGLGTQALAVYDQVLAQDPNASDNDWVWARKGRTLRVAKRYDEALQAFGQALKLNPQFSWAWNQQGIVQERKKDYEHAQESYQQALSIRQGDTWAAYNLANLHLRAQAAEQALTLLNKVLIQEPGNAQAQLKRGLALAKLNRHQEALAAYDEVIANQPNLGWAWFYRGRALMIMGRHEEAVVAFGRSGRELPRDPRPWIGLADAQSALGKFAEALPPLQQASLIQPDDASISGRLGELYRRLGRLDDALAAFAKAPEKAPGWFWLQQADSAVREGNLAAATEHYEQAIKASPQAVWPYRGYVLLLLKENRRQEALAMAETALEKVPSNTRDIHLLWALKGRALRALSEYEESLGAYDMCLSLNPRYAEGWNGKGLTYEEIGRRLDALAAFQQAIELEKTRPIFWYNQGKVLIALGRYEQAIQALIKANELAPQQRRFALLLDEARRKSRALG